LIWAVYQLRVHQIAMRMDSQFEARLAERTRIAQELHDTLLQGVLSASMQLHVANDQLGDDSPAKPLVRRVLELMGGVANDGRNAVRGLRISNDGAHDLERAFARIPQELALEDRAEFRIVVVGPSRDLRAIVRDEVYRIGREAVTNAFRHSGAKTVEFELEYAIHELRVSVRDDGCGINPQVLQRGRSGHWGLQGMRERAEKIDALLKVWSRSTGGTEVDLRVPALVAFEPQTPANMYGWLSKIYARKPLIQSEIGKRAG
jgi:signal transduction histidine kinase